MSAMQTRIGHMLKFVLSFLGISLPHVQVCCVLWAALNFTWSLLLAEETTTTGNDEGDGETGMQSDQEAQECKQGEFNMPDFYLYAVNFSLLDLLDSGASLFLFLISICFVCYFALQKMTTAVTVQCRQCRMRMMQWDLHSTVGQFLHA